VLLEEEPCEAAEAALVSREELNLTCFNLMIDVLMIQMDLQEVERHTGPAGPHNGDALALLNKMMSTPWLTDINR